MHEFQNLNALQGSRNLKSEFFIEESGEETVTVYRTDFYTCQVLNFRSHKVICKISPQGGSLSVLSWKVDGLLIFYCICVWFLQ